MKYLNIIEKNLTRKLRARWTPNKEEVRDLVMDKSSLKENMKYYFDHGYPSCQPVIGFFNWDGCDIERVKRDYPGKMTEEEKQIVLKYMKASTEEAAYMGFAMSRIEKDKILGTKDMKTPDGKWIFPEQWDSHYVEKYDIAPPRDFIDDALKWNKE